MYPRAHKKIRGRILSNSPLEGIPIAVETLSDPESHRDDYMISACYLCYRCLDKTYDNIEFAWIHINKAKEMIDRISIGKNSSWYVARWQTSIKLVHIYMRLCCLNQKTPIFELFSLATSNYSMLHPPQIVNVLRANSMMILVRYLQGKKELCEEHIYNYALPMFQKTIMLYNVPKDYDMGLSMVSELTEAVECVGFIMKMRNIFNDQTSDHIEKLRKLITNGQTGGSMKIYYRSLENILNQNIEIYENRDKEVE